LSVMNYQGYATRIEYSDEDGLFVGHIAGIRDVVGFHGESVRELREAFEEAVTDYLEVSDKLGREPQKPSLGRPVCIWNRRATRP
jgi:predicted HicB family RNase H-like nuclease